MRVMRPDTFVRRNPSIVFQRLAADGGGVLLHLDTEVSHNLNEVGVVVWDLLESPTTVRDLAERFCARFDEGAEAARHDVLGFLDALAERDLILTMPPGPEERPEFSD